MKIYFIALYFVIGALSSHAQLKTPSLSPSAKTIQTVGLTEIEVNYSRPSVKGRKIFGPDALVPYGEIWRTGANAATHIRFSTPILIQDQELQAGSYALLSIPNQDRWELKWYPYESSNWNSYVEKEPVLTNHVSVLQSKVSKESFEIQIDSIHLEGAKLVIEWEYTKLSIPLQVLTQKKVLRNIARTMNGPSSNDYYQAALYLHESRTDIEKALEYIQRVTASDKALFFQVTREAQILSDLNRNKEAVQAAERGLILSQKANNKDFIRLNKRIIQLNTP